MKIKRTLLFMILLIMILQTIISDSQGLLEYKEVRTLEIKAPAVTSTGQGTLSRITLAIAYPGHGRVFFSALPYSEVETQGAARVAAYIASLVANKRFSDYDYYVMVESTIPLIGGPSAGGLITVGLVALMLNLELLPNVTMTGMINPDGSIGKVGGLKEKLEASAQAGFKLFLIPAGQRIHTYPVIEERQVGPFIIRRVRSEIIDLASYGRTLGVDVVEVSNIVEAIEYFTGKHIGIKKSTPIVSYDLSRRLLPVINDLRNKINNTMSINQQLLRGAPLLYAYIYQNRLSNLRSAFENISTQAERYPVYASRALVNIYKESISIYFELGLLLGRLSVNDIIRMVNETLTTFTNEQPYSASRNECSLQVGFISLFTNLAISNYLLISDTNNSVEIINHATKALSSIELGKLYRALSSNITLDCSFDALTELYSHMYAIHAYVQRLMKEANARSNTEQSVNQILDVSNELFSRKDPGLYAGYIYVLSYNSMNIHLAAGSAGNLLNSRDDLIAMYESNIIDEIVYYYKRLVEESVSMNDQELALQSLLELIGILHVIRSFISKGEQIGQVSWTTNAVDPSASTNTSTSSQSGSSTTTERAEKAPSHLAYLEMMVLVVVIMGLAIITVRFLKSFR